MKQLEHLEAIEREIVTAILSFNRLRESSNKMPKEVIELFPKVRSKEQNHHEALTIVKPVDLIVEELVLIRSAKGLKFESSWAWISPTPVIENRSDLAFVVEMMRKDKREVFYSKCIMAYTVEDGNEQISDDLIERANFFGSTRNMVELLDGGGVINCAYLILVKWEDWNSAGDRSWEWVEKLWENVWNLVQQIPYTLEEMYEVANFEHNYMRFNLQISWGNCDPKFN